MNRDELKATWEGPVGIGARALLDAADSAGTWLWFEETVKRYAIDPERVQIGDICRAMIAVKLDELTKTKHYESRQPEPDLAAHIRGIDWALAQGYNMSVTDRCADEGEYDLVHSTDRAAIIEACQATDIPNVEIWRPLVVDGHTKHEYLLTFSVIDEGIPDETVNDWTVPNDDAPAWRVTAEKAFSKAVLS